MKMKRIVIILLILTLFGTVGCFNNHKTKENTANTKNTTKTTKINVTNAIETTLNKNVLMQLGYDVKYEKVTCPIELVSFKKNGKDVTDFDIPEVYTYNGNNYRITKIGSGVFLGCRSLKNVTIPESVTEIEENAFNACSSLTNIVIPQNITKISNRAFLVVNLLLK